MQSMFERAKNNYTILSEWYKLFELQFGVINPFEVEVVKKHLSSSNVNRLVDVGFGSGDLTIALKNNSGFNIDALEPEKYFYDRTLAKFPGSDVNFFNLSLAEYNYPRQISDAINKRAPRLGALFAFNWWRCRELNPYFASIIFVHDTLDFLVWKMF